jgi:hypothetical protein
VRSAGLLLAAALLLPSVARAEAPADPFAGLQFLVGAWKGVGSGKPGDGAGEFAFKPELGGKVLLRRNFAEYPPKPGEKQGTRHDDLMIVYPSGPTGGALKADYYDNEGHVIRYAVTTAAQGANQGERNTATFESEAGPGPRFKLVYEQKDAGTVGIGFSIAPPGKPYQPYISATAKRVHTK